MRILYNTTFSLPSELEEKFVSYMKDSYIPALMSGGGLSSPLLSRILSAEPTQGDVSYALQLVAPSREALEGYLSGAGRRWVEELLAVFGSSIAGFVTMMEIVPLTSGRLS